MRSLVSLIVVIIAIAGFYAYQTQAQAPAPAGAAASSLDRAAVEEIIKDYLLKNPKVIIDGLEAYQEQQAKAEKDKATKAISEKRTELFDSATTPRAGNLKDPDIKIVEFFDYHCGYCKHMVPVVTQLIKDDPKVQVVFHEFPILSKDSELAAKAAVAVYSLKPEAYFAYHTALMGLKGEYSETILTQEAEKVGVSKEAFTAALAKPEIQAEVDRTKQLARDIGISGTPAFIIGDQLLPGAAPLEDIKKMIADVRAKAAKP